MKKYIVLVLMLFAEVAFAKKISVHGHRGARSVRPENTISAFKYALEVGVDVLEFDLSVTKDNVLILSHDPWIDKDICLGPKGKKLKEKIPVNTLTLAEVKQFDCGSLINPRFKKQVPQKGERIPTLAEVFDFVKNSEIPGAKTVEFNIETKIVPSLPDLTPSPKQFAEMLVKELKAAGMDSRTIVQSFDHRTLYWVKKIDSKIRISQLTSDSMVDMVGAAKGISAEFISPYMHWISKDMVQRLHKNGIQVAPWTANEAKDWDYLISIGVDAIITDDPKALIDYLKKKKLR
tara:strand:+ start:124405 stop:125277 length:873 start_codon:yes stop_codon:yes gene_type:complete